MKRVHILGNDEKGMAEIHVSGHISMYGLERQPINDEAAREAARLLHRHLPRSAWQALRETVEILSTED
jgi:hypothetical protein